MTLTEHLRAISGTEWASANVGLLQSQRFSNPSSLNDEVATFPIIKAALETLENVSESGPEEQVIGLQGQVLTLLALVDVAKKRDERDPKVDAEYTLLDYLHLVTPEQFMEAALLSGMGSDALDPDKAIKEVIDEFPIIKHFYNVMQRLDREIREARASGKTPEEGAPLVKDFERAAGALAALAVLVKVAEAQQG